MNGTRINDAIHRSRMIEDINRRKYSFLIKKWDIYREKVHYHIYICIETRIGSAGSGKRGHQEDVEILPKINSS